MVTSQSELTMSLKVEGRPLVQLEPTSSVRDVMRYLKSLTTSSDHLFCQTIVCVYSIGSDAKKIRAKFLFGRKVHPREVSFPTVSMDEPLSDSYFEKFSEIYSRFSRVSKTSLLLVRFVCGGAVVGPLFEDSRKLRYSYRTYNPILPSFFGNR